MTFASAVPITAGTTYVASYLTAGGDYAADDDLLHDRVRRARRCTRWPTATDGPNGVYTYGATPDFPTSTVQARATTGWTSSSTRRSVPTTTPPTVVARLADERAPAAVSVGTTVTATFSEAMDPATIDGGDVRAARPRRTRSCPPRSATTRRRARRRSRRRRPLALLDHLHGDREGRARSRDQGPRRQRARRATSTWSFTTAAPPPPPPDRGPGRTDPRHQRGARTRSAATPPRSCAPRV